MINKKSNAYQGLIVMVLIAITLIGMFIVMKPFAMIYNMYTDNTKCGAIVTQGSCTSSQCFWEDGTCKVLPAKATEVIILNKKIWLTSAIIFIIGLIIYLVAISTRRNVQTYVR